MNSPGFGTWYRKMAVLQRVVSRNWKRLGPAVVLLTSATLAVAQGPQIQADDLVRQSVANELKAAAVPGHYMYRLRTETSGRSETKTMIQTTDWLIGRLTQVDGKPLSAGQRRQEDQRLVRMLSSPEQLRDEEQEQRKYEKRVWDIVRVFPEAFLYEYAETARGSDGDELVRLTFRPNPAFRSPSRELAVLRGTKGSVWIDSTAQRVVRVDATLFRPVDFGWGILVRLDEGGSFVLEGGKTDSGMWVVKTLQLHFTGKVLLVKGLTIDSAMKTADFRPMPDNLTLTEGLELLRKQDETMAQTAGSQ